MTTPSPMASHGAEQEDDYLTMTFDEPASTSKTETLTQRKKRLAREAEQRARPKSKAQIAEEERAKREAALNKTSLDTSSKGFKMMAALGYKPGTALGADRKTDDKNPTDARLLEPIGLEMKEGRTGIGADSEKKRKIREAFAEQEQSEKKIKVDEGDFRERQMKEREEKKMDRQFWAAMKVAEKLDEENDAVNAEKNGNVKPSNKLLSKVNVLWRTLAKQRAENERDRRMRYDLHQSLSRLPTYNDPDEEKDDQIALSRKDKLEEVDLELDQDDDELDGFLALTTGERLEKLVRYLRDIWHYCFWCKYRYPDEEMDGCPGLTEDDHD